MLKQVAPQLIERVRKPVEFYAAKAVLRIREELQYQQLTIEANEASVDIMEAFRVAAEQRDRAQRYGWQLVHVLPSVGSHTHAVWEGEKIPILSNASGPHWAIINGTRPYAVVLKERIVVLPGTQEEEQPLPPRLRERVTRLSPTVAKLLGRNT